MFAKHCEQGSLSNLECASSYKQPPLDVQSMNTSFYYYLLLQQLILLLLLVLLPLSHNGNIQKFAWKRFQPQGLAGQTKCCPNAGPALRAQGLIAMQNKCNKSQSITITSDFGMLHFFPKATKPQQALALVCTAGGSQNANPSISINQLRLSHGLFWPA